MNIYHKEGSPPAPLLDNVSLWYKKIYSEQIRFYSERSSPGGLADWHVRQMNKHGTCVVWILDVCWGPSVPGLSSYLLYILEKGKMSTVQETISGHYPRGGSICQYSGTQYSVMIHLFLLKPCLCMFLGWLGRAAVKSKHGLWVCAGGNRFAALL